MAVRTIPTATLTQGYVNQGWYNGRKATTVRQRCNLVGGTFFALNYALPPRARVVWAEMVAQSDVSVTTVTGGPASAAAGAYGLFMFPAATNATAPVTTPPSTATQAFTSFAGGTTGFLIQTSLGLTTAATNTARGIPNVYGTNSTNVPQNLNTVGAMIALLPVSTAATGLIAYPVATAYSFGSAATATTAAGTVDVTLYIEEYDQAPYA